VIENAEVQDHVGTDVKFVRNYPREPPKSTDTIAEVPECVLLDIGHRTPKP